MSRLLNRRIVRLLFVGFLTIGFPCHILSAAKTHGFCGDSVEWAIADGILTLSGSGRMQNFPKGKRPWPANRIKTIIIREGITNIGNRAFENHFKLIDISIPNSIQTIGDSAFLNCANLKKIVLPNSVMLIGDGCFSKCSKIDSIVLSDSLEHIGERAFDGCASMTDILLPDSVHFIGSSAFRGCYALTILIVPDEPFEIIGKDSVLGLRSCKQLSLVRGNHVLCPDYMLKYLPNDCPFMREGNPRRYYVGSISKDSVVIVPALRTYTWQEAIDTIENIFNQHFSISNPSVSYSVTEELISRFIINLERPIYRDVLQHYYDKFYEAGSNNELEVATAFAFKYVMLGGKEDEELMWDIILTKYGSDNETNHMRFLMNKFNEISTMKDSVYQHTIDSLTNVYYDVIYPSTLRDMCGYWVSVNDTMDDGSLTNVPDYIIHIADITCPNGTTILSAPKCNWSAKKKKGQWQNQTYDNAQLRYSYETGYNQQAQTLQLLFSSQSKKIANAKLQHQSLDMVQNLEATMSASLEQYQRELNKALANNLISFGNWGTSTALGFGVGLGVQVVAAAVIYAIIYASNIETAQKYEIQLTPQAPEVLDGSVKYTFAEHNYNNGKTKYKEDVKKLTFVKWTEADSVIFISKRLQPIFCGEEISTSNPILEVFNTKKDKPTCQKINQTSIDKLRQKAEDMLRVKERKETSDVEQPNVEDSEEELFFY